MTTVSDYTALLSGDYWNGIEATGKPVIVTYSFPTSAPAYDASVSGFTASTVSSFQAFGAAEQTQARQALGEWAAASGITFVEVAPGKGDINFQLVDLSTSSYGSPGGIGFYPFGNWDYGTYPSFSSDLDASGDVFMNSQDVSGATPTDPTSGTVNYGTLLHEIGHAIGLKHPTEIVYSPTTEHDQILDTGDDPTRTIMATVGDTSNADPHILQLDKDADAFIYGASGGQVVSNTSSITTGSNAVSNWSWNPTTQTLTQTAVTSDETIRGSSVTDVITATSGNNRLFGLNGNDTLTGGSGNDYLDGGPGADVMTGSDGNDTYIVDDPGDQVIETSASGGYDIVNSTVSYTLPANVEQLQLYGAGLTGVGNDLVNTLYGDSYSPNTLKGMGGNDYIVAGHNNDTLDGGTGNDSLYGDAGNDTLIAGTGVDYLYGGTGFDAADYSADSAALTINLTRGTASSTTENDMLYSIEHVRGGSGADTITAGPGTSFTQPDLVKSSSTQNSGVDTAVDLDGSFRIKSDSTIANSASIPHATVDATSAGENEYYSFSVVDPGDVATLYATSAGSAFTPFVSIYDATGALLASQNMPSGSAGLSYTFATSGEYIVEVQNGGNNPIPSGDAYTLQLSLTNEVNEWLEGGAGNDTLVANTGWERLDGGAGVDTVSFGALGFGINASLATGTASGSNGNYTLIGIENLTGTPYADTLTGDGGDNVLGDGGAGAADALIGGGGNDTYNVYNSGDVITEAANGGTDQVLARVSYTLGANVENLTLYGTGNINGTGNTLSNVLVGNTGSNVLTGGGGNDVFNDGGAGGTDTLIGGSGDDTYNVYNSGDIITEATNGGTDQVLTRVDYTLGANIENLSLYGTANINGTGNALNNILVGNIGSNVLTGGGGNDIFNDGGAGGTDTMIGGSGNDTYNVYNSGDIITEAANGGTDQVLARVDYTLGANIENLSLYGTANINGTGNALNNILVGNIGSNVLTGGGGNDVFNDGGAGGTDTMIGGSGNDTYNVYNSGDIITEAANGGTDQVLARVNYTLGANIENLALYGTANINGTGNALSNILVGNTGSNVLTGGGGNDIFNDGGAGGTDTMIGGSGNDTYNVYNSGDIITEAANGGTDQVLARVNYTLGANIENLTLYGTAGINGTGNALNNVLVGNSGNNVLDGGGGVDTLVGGGGQDSFLFDTAIGGGALATITDFSVGNDMIELDRQIFSQIAADGSLAGTPSAFATGTSAQNAATRILYNSATGDIFYDPDGNGSQAAIKFAHVAAGTALTASNFTAIG